ncbi:hypothetical protein BV25DRAFT_1830623 [Artomyces pyxidatus]|uniref:Uncharacterized protein n=1 Tax=Artomyces pyxidatus TaxID=48021 RepID=A0ACB8SPW7_9AGAM|nr:hypothetical protein BV25DRAFT_1830623 [Artomyces pyxidatus]
MPRTRSQVANFDDNIAESDKSNMSTVQRAKSLHTLSIPTFPLDVLFEIFSYVTPAELLSTTLCKRCIIRQLSTRARDAWERLHALQSSSTRTTTPATDREQITHSSAQISTSLPRA